MSQPTNRPTASAQLSSPKSTDSLAQKLPDTCRVPGYWEALAFNSDNWAHEISASPLWREAKDNLENWKKEYRRKYSGSLYKESTLQNFVGKAAGRIREKVFDKISRAEDQAVEISRIFDQRVAIPRLEDLVRVRIETQFLDGVPFLATKILDLAKSHDPYAKIEPKGKLSGYFAQHVTFALPVYFRFAGSNHSCNVTCEVQVATTLATLVWENSHGLYESSRSNLERSEDWQWSPNDPRFLSRQLGHMIHLADGLFCNLRDQSKTQKQGRP